jgi:protein-S-isoprenylcysteine O-methyltransferase Ste14
MALTMLADFEALSLSLSILLITYATYLCGTPPHPTPYNSTKPDSVRAAVSPSALFVRRFINAFLGISHAYLCLTYPTPPRLLCPNPSNLEPYLFTWTPYSIIFIAIIIGGCFIRLWAFSALGSNFTFRLAEPKKFITSGLYKYAQHPSYTGKALIIVANLALIQRPDGLFGCWLPKSLAEAKLLWRVLSCLIVLSSMYFLRKRVKEEEAMMKDTFGKEWESWHARTKRFVPGLF